MTDETNSVEALYAEQEWLLRLARGLLRNEDCAEDIVQETWLRYLKGKRPALHSPRSFLGTTIRRVFLSRRQAEEARKRREVASGTRDMEALSTESLVARTELQGLLHQALQQLPVGQRRVVILRYFGDLGPVAIAEREGIPLETVRTRLKRGMAKLRQVLKPEQESGSKFASLAVLALPRSGGTRWPILLGALLVTKKQLAIALTLMFFAAAYFAVEHFAEPANDRLPDLQQAAQESNVVPRRHEANTGEVSKIEAMEGADDALNATPSLPAKAKPLLISGRLIDEQGNPIAEARLYSHLSAPMTPELVMDRAALVRFQWRDRLHRQALTDRSGRFCFEAIEDAPHDLVILSQRHRAIAAWSVDPGADLELTTELAGTVTFVVQDEGGLPIADATVLVMHFGNEAIRHIYRKLETPQNGEITLPAPPKDDIYALVIRHPDFELTSVMPYSATKEGKADRVVVTVKRGRSVRLEFLLPPDATMAEGTLIALQSRSLFAPIEASVNSKGVATVPHVPTMPVIHLRFLNDSWHIEPDPALDRQRRDRMVDDLARMGEPFVLPSEGDASLQIRLKKRPTVSGFVRDTLGRPVADVEVQLRAVAASMLAMRSEIVRGRTDQEGRFSISDVPAGARYFDVVSDAYRLVVDRDIVHDLGAIRVSEMVAVKIEIGQDDADVELRVRAASSVKGRVIDEKGLGIPGVQITAFRDFEDERGADRNAWFYMSEISSPETTTTSDGRFSLSGLANDRPLRLVAHAPDMVPAWSQALKTRPGESLDGVTITMQEPLELAGRCRDEQRNPVADFGLTISPSNSWPIAMSEFHSLRIKGREFTQPRNIKTDSEGRFFIAVSRGEIRVQASDKDAGLLVAPHSTHLQVLRADDQNPVIDLIAPATYRLRLVDTKGQIIPGAQCVLYPLVEGQLDKDLPISARSDTTGCVTIHLPSSIPLRLSRAVWFIGSRALNYEPMSSITVRAGASQVDVELRRIPD